VNRCYLGMSPRGCLNRDCTLLTINRAALFYCKIHIAHNATNKMIKQTKSSDVILIGTV